MAADYVAVYDRLLDRRGEGPPRRWPMERRVA
jgi:hypothetical protein